MKRITLPILFACLLAQLASAAAPATAPAQGATKIVLSLSPRPTTQPALKYRLLPDLIDTKPGNSVPLYMTAVQLASQIPSADLQITAEEAGRLHLPPPQEGVDRVGYFLDKQFPLDRLPQQANATVTRYANVLQYVDLGARRRETHWEPPLEDLGYQTLLPHLQVLRQIARANCLRIRTQLAAGDFDGAAKSLQTNFALARSISEESVLISSMVAIAIDTLTLEQVAEWMGRPDAPNLHWPLANLPRPLVDLRQGMMYEKQGLFATLPELKRVRTGDFTGEDWRRMTSRLMNIAGAEPPSATQSLKPAFAGIMMYPAAREYFRRQGMTAAQIDEMPQAMVLGRYMLETYETWSDELAKWSNVPYWQSIDGLLATEDAFQKERGRDTFNPLYTLIPASVRICTSFARLDRQVALLQTIEAVRAYAAGHGGKLPTTLEEVKGLPIPIDPMTGKAFAYTSDGVTATITSPVPPRGQPRDALHVELSIRAAK